MKPLLISSGEPAGVGPDLCVSLPYDTIPCVILGDEACLKARAEALGISRTFHRYDPNIPPVPGTITVYPVATQAPVQAGQLNVRNAPYVVSLLNTAATMVLAGYFSGLVTAPIHKGIINESGLVFSGHTEHFASLTGVTDEVMMLASGLRRVALVTTHIPLQAVSQHVTAERLEAVIRRVHSALQHDFGIASPRILVTGLNPHAGENGYLGQEEMTVITPVITQLQQAGLNVRGPYPADTVFTPDIWDEGDVVIAMYHDQGLPVLKYLGFKDAVNVTLGLPFIRTSVDHGTALSLAGTGKASTGSLIAAIEMAYHIAQRHPCA